MERRESQHALLTLINNILQTYSNLIKHKPRCRKYKVSQGTMVYDRPFLAFSLSMAPWSGGIDLKDVKHFIVIAENVMNCGNFASYYI